MNCLGQSRSGSSGGLAHVNRRQWLAQSAALAKLEAADLLLARENPPTNSRRVDIALATADALDRLGRRPEARERLARLLGELGKEPAADPDDPKMVSAALARMME